MVACAMTLRRIILLGLLIPAVAMTVVQIIRPDETLEMVCIVFVVPVAVMNAWEWTALDSSEWEKLRGRFKRDFHPIQSLRGGWLASVAARQGRSAYEDGGEKSAPAGETETRDKKFSIETARILWKKLWGRFRRDFHPIQSLREGWLASVAARQGRSAYEDGREKSAPAGETETRDKKLSMETPGILWEKLWGRFKRDFHLNQWLRERWLAVVAARQRKPAYEDGEERSAPADETGTRNKKLSILIYGGLLVTAGVVIMAAVFARTGFGAGMFIAGMLGFIAFVAGMYLTFG